jgi:hypothetical protein
MKFERYISKNTPSNILATIKEKTTALGKDYYGRDLTGNYLSLYHGYIQKKNVEPKHLSPVNNVDRVGVHLRGGPGPVYANDWTYIFSEHSSKRRMRVWQSEINHMQSTPYVRKGFWTVKRETLGAFRGHGMLWGRCGEDPFYKWSDRDEMKFGSCQEAVAYARYHGYEVDVIYPHERYHMQKAYADNFVFQKEKIEDLDDPDSINIDMFKI